MPTPAPRTPPPPGGPRPPSPPGGSTGLTPLRSTRRRAPVSKLPGVKDPGALGRGFGSVAAEHGDAHLLVLGIGDPTRLRSIVHELGLGERVSVLAPRPDVPQVLAAMDVFVHAALAESFGY